MEYPQYVPKFIPQLTCIKCNESFETENDYQSHDANNCECKGSHKCAYCPERFSTRYSMREHIKTCPQGYFLNEEISQKGPSEKVSSQSSTSTEAPNENNVDEGTGTAAPNEMTSRSKQGSRIKCFEEGCVDQSFRLLRHYRHHLKVEHGMVIQESTYKFISFEEFSRWKIQLEEAIGIPYNAMRGEYKARYHKGFTQTYHCQRSGKYKPRGTSAKKLKTQGSVKLGFYCTSTINIKCLNDGRVICTYYKTHHGHGIGDSVYEIKHTPISTADKLFMTEMLFKGVDEKQILEDLHKRGGRSEYITKSDIKNHIRNTGMKELLVANKDNNENPLDEVKRKKILEDIQKQKYVKNPIRNSEINEHPVATEDNGGNMSTGTLKENRTVENNIQTEIESAIAMYKESHDILIRLGNTLNQSASSIDTIRQITHHLRVIDNAVHKKQPVFVAVLPDSSLTNNR